MAAALVPCPTPPTCPAAGWQECCGFSCSFKASLCSLCSGSPGLLLEAQLGASAQLQGHVTPEKREPLAGGRCQPAIPPSYLLGPHRSLQKLLEGFFTMQRMWDTPASPHGQVLSRSLSLSRPLHARGWACRISHRTLVNLEFWTTNESCFGIASMSHILDLEFLFAKSGGVTRRPDKSSGREGHWSPFPSTAPNSLGPFVSALPSLPSASLLPPPSHGLTPRRGREENLHQLKCPVCVAFPAHWVPLLTPASPPQALLLTPGTTL